MPGLFGCFIKAAGAGLDVDSLAEGMASRLSHRQDYAGTVKRFDRGFAGVVDLGRRITDPVKAPNGRLSVVCYGDIFAFDGKELESNGEALALLSREAADGRLRGKAIGEKLNGDYNLAVVPDDRTRGAEEGIVLLNDRFGYRRLFVYEDGKVVLFAPECKAFLAYDGFDRSLDERGLVDFMLYGYALGDRTLLRSCRLLPPASSVRIDDSGVAIDSYWCPRYTNDLGEQDLDEAVERGEACFTRSIERRTRGAGTCVVPISGGLDSRLILATVARKGGMDITPVTFGIPGCTEHRIAKRVCAALSLGSPRLVEDDATHLARHLRTAAHFTECNCEVMGLTLQHHFAATVGSEFDVFLNGIFGGHLTFGSPYYKESELRGGLTDDYFRRALFRGLNGPYFDLLLGRCATAGTKDLVEEHRYTSIEEEWARARSVAEVPAMCKDYVFAYNRLRRVMNAIDQNRMYYNDQLPFAGYETYELYLQLGPSLALGHVLYKEIYKRKHPALARIPWWSTGADLYHAPSRLRLGLRRLSDTANWYVGRLSQGRVNIRNPLRPEYRNVNYRRSGEARDFVRGLLLSDRFLDRGLFERAGVENLIQWQEKGGSAASELSKLVTFEMWARDFLD